MRASSYGDVTKEIEMESKYSDMKVERRVGSKGAKEITGTKNTMFYALQQEGSRYYDVTFPKAFRLTPGAKGRSYLVSELDAWVRSKAAQRDQGNV